MDAIEQAIGRLTTKRQIVAFEALNEPQSKDLFAYGQAVGIQQGFKMALTELNDIIADDASDDEEGLA